MRRFWEKDIVIAENQ